VLNVAARPGEQFSDEELRFLETVGQQVCIAVERGAHLRAERLRNQEARAMAAISKSIGSSLDVRSVLRSVGETAGELLGADQLYILLGSDPQALSVGYLSGQTAPGIAEGGELDLVALGWPLSQKALAERVLVRMDDRATNGHVNRSEAERIGVASGLVAPLLSSDSVRGLLIVARMAPHRWTPEELDLTEALASQASVAIENARLYDDARKAYESERKRNQEARAMATISKAIGGSLDAKAVLEAVGRSAREIVGAERVQIFLGSDPQHLTVANVSGPPHAWLREGQTLDLDALGAPGHHEALTERVVLTVNDWRSDPRVAHELGERWQTGAALLLPLLARKRTLGLLVITRGAACAWSDEDVDVAEALAAQASVALENARLYQEARRGYQDLKDAQQRILHAEKMAVLGTFASGLAHEVRNPLNSISLQLSVFERRLGRVGLEHPEELQDVVGVIREEIGRLDNLVGDFLMFSRTNRIQYTPASLDVLIDDVVRLLRPEARAGGITLRRQRIGTDLPETAMDGQRMKQVVINLVRNAIEAMPDGGQVIVESGLVDGRAQIVVRDSGPGLPQNLDVFQLFVTTKDKGTGLGLSIAQQIVLEHGGEITAASEPGHGAVFKISLPIEPLEEARPERRQS
jgi:signal transduction histidine kinase